MHTFDAYRPCEFVMQMPQMQIAQVVAGREHYRGTRVRIAAIRCESHNAINVLPCSRNDLPMFCFTSV